MIWPRARNKFIGVLADDVKAAEEATAALVGDLRFEHFDHADDEVRRFVAECWADHVPAFVARHAAEVTHAACYLPVEFLTVSPRPSSPAWSCSRSAIRGCRRRNRGSPWRSRPAASRPWRWRAAAMAGWLDGPGITAVTCCGVFASRLGVTCTTGSSGSASASDTPSTSGLLAGTVATTRLTT